MSHRIEIEFSNPELRSHALNLAADVLEQWAHELAAITLVPHGSGDIFAIVLDGERIFLSDGDGDARAPDLAEINSAIEARVGPPPGGGA